VVVRGGGDGVTKGATTATMAAIAVGYAVVVPPLPVPRLSQVVIIGHWWWWRGTPRGGATYQRRGAALASEAP
jgi:hypothetical protein